MATNRYSQEHLDPLLALYAPAIVPALDQLPMPTWITDTRGHVRWANAAVHSVFGSTLGLHFSSVVARECVNEARELFARTVLGSADATVQKAVLRRRDVRLAVEMTSVPLRAEGTAIGVLTIFRPNDPTPTARREPPPHLTPRQHETLEHLAHGLSTPEIAARMQVAEETARNHVRALLRELGVHSRLEAVVKAFRNEWL
ncbi:MAG: LuxR C-terminal-related transcriptional regulator [Gaiellaceae bacterium]